MCSAESEKSKQLLFQVSQQTRLCFIPTPPPQREVMLITAENNSRENLLAGLRVFVQDFPSQIPLQRCSSNNSCSAFMMLFSFYLADL